MILADTSVWIDHLRRGDHLLAILLERNDVLMHSFVIGELAMGTLEPRNAMLTSLRQLPTMLPARNSEVFALIESARLYETGIGYIDVHLLAAVRMIPEAKLWTRDRRLADVAERLSLAARPHDA